jgi:predicted PurR-regulated permease PerM
MKAKIDIDNQTFIRFWLVLFGLVLVGYAIYSVRTALIIIGAALFFAIALSPWVNRLAKIFPSKSRILGTALAYFSIILVLGLIVFLVLPPVIDQSAKFAKTVPDLVDAASKQYNGVTDFVQRYNLQSEFSQMIASIKGSATEFASNIGPKLITSISSIFSTITSLILVLVLAFLMLVEAPTWLNLIWNSYRDKKLMKKHRQLSTKMYSVVTSYVTGQLTVSSIAATVSGLTVFILSLFFNMPANLAIPAAAIIFVSSLIPLFGATIGAILICLLLMLNNFTAAIIFLIIFVIYQQIEGNYISPKIQSKKIDLSALAILLSITIGIYLFGIAGGIISIPIAGCIRVLIEDYSDNEKAESATNDLTS